MPRILETGAALLAGSTMLLIAGSAWAETVTTQLGWLRNGQFAPVLVADANGYFKEEGIEHIIRDGGPGKNPVPIVAAGQADFGISVNGRFVIAARLAPDPINIIALGTLYQDSPYSYVTITDPDAPEPTPKDLEGKRIGIQADGDFLLRAFAKENGLDTSTMTITTVQGGAEPLLVGSVDFMSAFMINQPYQIEIEAAKPDAPENLKGKTWKAIPYAKYGTLSYPQVIFATDAMIEKNPELVKRYLRALTKGLRFVLENPTEAHKIVAAYPGQVDTPEKVMWQMKNQQHLFESDDTRKNGLLWMNPDVWARMVTFYKQAGEIPREIPVDTVMTNKFLPGPEAR
ncbi:hypothetical protein Amn_45120 [Aminobacter sp. Y103A]|uniref:ABC transporter substrate-binding protein n=1 Tax=Aminobacter sp. Y103A TaxID=1870862 RepID=UPI002572353C|nr:ABC transporter substrate-binding protein [Aminobacter sp. SS-2016]BBD39632.1 hypothetical protein Amn_45120 [Aminobacter sp. SS-2016]